MATRKTKLATIYPIHVTSYGIGDAALMISENMRSDDLDVTFFSPASGRDVKSEIKIDLFGKWLKKVYYKFTPVKWRQSIQEWLLFKKTQDFDILYVWPGTSNDFIRKVKERGQTVILENINCHHKTAGKILGAEYERLGLPAPTDIDESTIAAENERLNLCDYVFSPGPEVYRSLVDANVSDEKILNSSYGLKSVHRLNSPPINEDNQQFNALFVGRVGIRKGVHLLLEYWRDAKIDGKLKIVGAVEPEFHPIAEKYKDEESIEFIAFTRELEKLYQEADLFIIPSLEEGSPLVTYLAIGAGLPCLVSPMGGEGVIRDGVDGHIIDPNNRNAWIDHLRSTSKSPALRTQMAKSSFERSEEFLWQNVGKKRGKLIIDKLSNKE